MRIMQSMRLVSEAPLHGGLNLWKLNLKINRSVKTLLDEYVGVERSGL